MTIFLSILISLYVHVYTFFNQKLYLSFKSTFFLISDYAYLSPQGLDAGQDHSHVFAFIEIWRLKCTDLWHTVMQTECHKVIDVLQLQLESPDHKTTNTNYCAVRVRLTNTKRIKNTSVSVKEHVKVLFLNMRVLLRRFML